MDVLPQDAAFTNGSVRHHVTKVPDLGVGPDRAGGIHKYRRMDKTAGSHKTLLLGRNLASDQIGQGLLQYQRWDNLSRVVGRLIFHRACVIPTILRGGPLETRSSKEARPLDPFSVAGCLQLRS